VTTPIDLWLRQQDFFNTRAVQCVFAFLRTRVDANWGTTAAGRIYPDFSFADAAGDRIIWEHLGMLDDHDYKAGWEWKQEWYHQNGYVLGRNLFTTKERIGQGLDSNKLKAVIDQIKTLLT